VTTLEAILIPVPDVYVACAKLALPFIAELYRLWEWGVFDNYYTSWVHFDPIDADHPNGIYFMQMKWNVSKYIGTEWGWFLSMIGAMLFAYASKNKWAIVATREFVLYRLCNVVLWPINYKTDYFALTFVVLTLANVIWFFIEDFNKPQPS